MEQRRTAYDSAQLVLQKAHYVYCLSEVISQTDPGDINHSQLANLISDEAQTLENLASELSDEIEKAERKTTAEAAA